MFEAFSERCRQMMKKADDAAWRERADAIDVQHMLPGLLQLNSGVARNVLHGLKVDVGGLQRRAALLSRDDSPAHWERAKLPLTERAKSVIKHAIEEARGLNQAYVGTQHFLLALWREQEGPLADVLAPEGLELDSIRDEVVRQIQAGADDRK